MARTSQEKQALIERIQASRSQLGEQIGEMRRQFNIPARLGESVRRKPFQWFGASAGLGLVASQLFRLPWKRKRGSKFLGLLATTAFGLFKPRLIQVITSELQRRVMGYADPKRNASAPTFPLSNS